MTDYVVYINEEVPLESICSSIKKIFPTAKVNLLNDHINIDFDKDSYCFINTSNYRLAEEKIAYQEDYKKLIEFFGNDKVTTIYINTGSSGNPDDYISTFIDFLKKKWSVFVDEE